MKILKLALTVILLLFFTVPSSYAYKKTPNIIPLEPVGIDELNINDLTIKEIIKDSPAEKAGLQVGDKVVKINGTRVDSLPKLLDLMEDQFERGNAFTFSVKRNKETLDIAVPLLEMKTRLGMVVFPKKSYLKDKSEGSTITNIYTNYGSFEVTKPNIEENVRQLLFIVTISNKTDKPLEIDPSNIEVYASGVKLSPTSVEDFVNQAFIDLSVAQKLPPLENNSVNISPSQSVNVQAQQPMGYTVSDNRGRQVTVTPDPIAQAGQNFTNAFQQASQNRIAMFQAEIAAYPMQEREALKQKMIDRETVYLNLKTIEFKKTTLEPRQSIKGQLIFGNPYLSTDIAVKANIGNEEARIKFKQSK